MTLLSHREVKRIRKQHRCAGCRKLMAVGLPATRWSGTSDGEFWSQIYHTECYRAENRLNDIHGTHGTDDWIVLSGHESEDVEFLLEEFPVVAERFGYQRVAA
jgi:hypothetical protein